MKPNEAHTSLVWEAGLSLRNPSITREGGGRKQQKPRPYSTQPVHTLFAVFARLARTSHHQVPH